MITYLPLLVNCHEDKMNSDIETKIMPSMIALKLSGILKYNVDKVFQSMRMQQKQLHGGSDIVLFCIMVCLAR